MRSNLIGNYSLSVINLIIPVVTAPLVARQLSLTDFGHYSFLQIIGVYLSAFVDYGITNYGTREISILENDEERRNFWYKTIAIKVLTSFFAFPLVLLFSFLIHQDVDFYIALSFLIVCVSSIFNGLWMINALEKTAGYIYIGLVFRFISAGLVLLTAYYFRDPKIVFLFSAIGTLFSNYSTFTYLQEIIHLDLKADFQGMRTNLKYGWYFAYSSMLGLLLNNSIVLFAGSILGPVVAAGISVNDRIVKGLLSLAAPFTTSSFPAISNAIKTDRDGGFKKLLLYLFSFLLLYTILCIVIYVFKDAILGIFGRQYIKFSPILSIMLIWSWVGVFNNFIPMQYLFSTNRERQYSQIFTISGIITVVGYVFLPKFFGENGIPFSALLGELMVTLFGLMIVIQDFYYLRRRI